MCDVDVVAELDLPPQPLAATLVAAIAASVSMAASALRIVGLPLIGGPPYQQE